MMIRIPASFPHLLRRTIIAPRQKSLSIQPLCGRSLPSFPQRRFQSVSASNAIPHDFAFAFDIDGVLLHGPSPIPSAPGALTHLLRNHVPFLLLTNGGGSPESARVRGLTQKLCVPIQESQFVQSHTPFKAIAEAGRLPEHVGGGKLENAVLVIGDEEDRVRRVAEGYGFKNVVMSHDVLVADPHVWPFSKVTEKMKSHARPLPLIPGTQLPEGGKIKFDAIFIFNDSRDWALDTQLVIDILLSQDGVLGTEAPHNSKSMHPTPPIFFSNPDIIWSSSHPTPRLGQGAFHLALSGVWAHHPYNPIPGSPLPNSTIIGKPHRATYLYAESVLSEFIKTSPKPGNLKRVYMVGDNPDSDIRGANDFTSERGVEWISVLVKTGVYRDGKKTLAGATRPKKIVSDVGEAVRWTCEREERICRGETVEPL